MHNKNSKSKAADKSVRVGVSRRIYPFLFNTLRTAQCCIHPLNPRFSPFIEIGSCFPRVFNRITVGKSIRWNC
jgi:hypothetical protein